MFVFLEQKLDDHLQTQRPVNENKKLTWFRYLKNAILLPHEFGSEKNTLHRQISYIKEELDRHSSLKYFTRHVSQSSSQIQNILLKDANRVFNFEERAGLLVLIEYDGEQS